MLELDAFRMGEHLGLDGIQYSFDEVGRGWDLRTIKNREAVRRIDYDGWLVIESAVPKGMDVRQAYEHNTSYLQSLFG